MSNVIPNRGTIHTVIYWLWIHVVANKTTKFCCQNVTKYIRTSFDAISKSKFSDYLFISCISSDLSLELPELKSIAKFACLLTRDISSKSALFGALFSVEFFFQYWSSVSVVYVRNISHRFNIP